MEDLGTEAFGAVNWSVCIILLLASVFIGIYSSFRGKGNNTTEEYLLGGRQMSSIPVALSLIASTVSAISILGLASEMYFYGTQFVLILAGSLYGTLILQFLVVPILYPLDMLSINEYITLRFGSPGLRKLSSVSLVINNLVYNGIALYAPSLTLSTVTGLSSDYSIIILGFICSFYITIGGVKAIVYTDVLQTIFIFLGIIVTIVICVSDLNGFGNIFSIANEGGRIEFFNFDPSPFVRYTFWSVQVQGLYNMISWIGLSQMGYMRFSSVPHLSIAKRLCLYYFVGLCVLWLTFFFSGILAYAVYSTCDPLTSGRIDEPDQILPYLVIHKISHITGIGGLFAAAIYSGTLSSLSTYASSSAAMIWQDLLQEMKFFKGYSDEKATMMLKILSAVIGVSAIGFAMLVKMLGNIVAVANAFINGIGASMVGIFIVGMFAPWVNIKGAYAGFFTALAFNMWLMAGQFITGLGKPEKLPLSTEGCPENLDSVNSTFMRLLNYTENQAYASSAIVSEGELNGKGIEKGIYDLSYCYTGIIGIIVYYIVASIVSLTTGPPNPSEVDARLIDPTCLKLYKRVFAFCKNSHSETEGNTSTSSKKGTSNEAKVENKE